MKSGSQEILGMNIDLSYKKGLLFKECPLRLAFICSFLILVSFRVPDLISPPTPHPFVQPPPVRVDTKKIDRLENIDPRNAEEEYELALYYILAGELDQAKIHLAIALELYLS